MLDYENLDGINLTDILDDENFIDLGITYDIINAIVSKYIQRGLFQQSRLVLNKFLSFFGKFAAANIHLMSKPNPYWINFLEQYSYYCAIYARSVLEAKDYQNAFIIACAAASINPDLKDGLLTECSNIASRSMTMQGRFPTITLEQQMMQNPFNYSQCVEQLATYLCRNQLPH